MLYLGKALTFLRSHLLLVFVGISCELIYLLYFVRQYSLLQYYHGLTDIGIITGHSHTGFALYVFFFTVLFALFGLAWWEIRNLSERSALWVVFGFGALFVLTMIFVYPGTAIDVYIYIVHSLVLVQYHANPMITIAARYSDDPLMQLAGGWRWYPAPYGPLGIIINALPTLVVGRNVLANLLLLKFMFSTTFLVDAFLIYKILSRIAPKLALAGALFIVWNPYALFEYCANSHNDVSMMLFVLLALLMLLDKRFILAFILIVASALVKYATLPLIPLFFIYGFVHQPSKEKRITFSCWSICFGLALVDVVFGPFWRGPDTLGPLLYQDQRYQSSFSTMLNDMSSMHITLEQAKQVGRVLFGMFYLFALFLSTRNLTKMILACFITLYFFLAFGTTNFEIWYAIWPVMIAVLIPRIATSLSSFFLLYGASISATFYVYIWWWIGFQDPNTVNVIHNMAYQATFVPATLILFGFVLYRGLSAKDRIAKRGEDIAPAAQIGEADQEPEPNLVSSNQTLP